MGQDNIDMDSSYGELKPGYTFQMEDDEFMSVPTVNISDWDAGNVRIVVSKVTFA